MTILGYPRPKGMVGTRNHIGIISTVGCANDITAWIASQVPPSSIVRAAARPSPTWTL
jgi:altronate dehydratase large subunit